MIMSVLFLCFISSSIVCLQNFCSHICAKYSWGWCTIQWYRVM